MGKPRPTPKSFEETYPDYPFANLVRAGVGIAGVIVRRRRRRQRETGL